MNGRLEPLFGRTFTGAWPFTDGRAAVEEDDKWGLIDIDGRWVVPPTYSYVISVGEGLFRAFSSVEEEGSRVLDVDGSVVVPYGFRSMGHFSGGKALATTADGTPVIVDRRGQTRRLLIEGDFDFGGESSRWEFGFHEGLASFRSGGRWGYFDAEGKVVIPPRFSEASEFSEGKAVVIEDGRGGVIDRTGAWVIEPTFRGSLRGRFREGLLPALLCKRGWTACSNFLMNEQGQVVHEFSDDMVAHDDYNNGLLLVAIEPASGSTTLWGYVDRGGALAFPADYHYARPFSEGLAVVYRDGRGSLIDVENRIVLDLAPLDARQAMIRSPFVNVRNSARIADCLRGP